MFFFFFFFCKILIITNVITIYSNNISKFFIVLTYIIKENIIIGKYSMNISEINDTEQ